MSDHRKYSDEHINAYIDGELDHNDRASLLFDEQADATLARRISEARVLKEKVQLAFAEFPSVHDEERTFCCTAFVRHHKSLVAGLLVLFLAAGLLLPGLLQDDSVAQARLLIRNTTAVAAADISDLVAGQEHVVINISQYQEQGFDKTIDYIEALLVQRGADDDFSVEIVANKSGLKVLDSESSPYAGRISQLAARFDNLDVVACARSLADLASAGDPVQLMHSIIITPSAAEQVAKRTAEGWFYLKL